MRRLARLKLLCLAPRSAIHRCVGSTAKTGTNEVSPKDTPVKSAIDVENFTLNEDVVKRDMEALQRWNSLSCLMDTFRAGKQHRDMLDAVSQGLAMLEEMGAMNAPIQCEALLHLEAAQAHYNLEEFESALQCAQRAKGVLMEARAELRDAARVAETNTLIGYILLKSGKIDEANDVFTEVLQWIDVDAKTTTPMQAVSAVNLRRSVVSGLGFCYHRLAEREQTSGGSAKELFGKALDLLIEALNAHIDENDHDSVKLTLLSVLQCFDGVGDGGQATTTAEKLVRWCGRHHDEEGAALGAEWREKMEQKYGKNDS